MVEKILSSKGKLEWVNIKKPKENLNGVLQYSLNLVLEENDPFIEKILSFWEENKPKGFKKQPKSTGIYEHYTKDENGEKQPTGLKTLSFKTGTTYQDGSDKKIKTYNSKAREIILDDETNVGNGSIGVVSGAMDVYIVKSPQGAIIDAGVTLYLDSLQIIKLVKYSNNPGFMSIEDQDGEDNFVGDDTNFQDQEALPVNL